MMINISQYPDIQERLADEIRHYNLDRPDVTIEELDQSKLLEQVVKESLRVFPAVPSVFPRRLIKDFQLGKYKFSKGDRLNIMIAPLMWDEDVFQGGQSFKLNTVDDSNKR